MAELVLALLAFVASHAIPANPRLRGPLVARLGKPLYMVLYSLLSLAVIAWIAMAYRDAPVVELWPQAPWTRWVPFLLMLPASLLLAAGLATPNPFSLGRGAKGFDFQRPGILRLTRHPFLWGLTLWAGAHLVPNGDLASLILFGLLLALPLLGMLAFERRRRAALGADWGRLAAQTGTGRLRAGDLDWRWLLAGLVLWALLLGGHPHVIGVSPLPVELL